MYPTINFDLWKKKIALIEWLFSMHCPLNDRGYRGLDLVVNRSKNFMNEIMLSVHVTRRKSSAEESISFKTGVEGIVDNIKCLLNHSNK